MEIGSLNSKNAYALAAVLAAYALVTAIMTYPAVFNLQNALMGGNSDAYSAVWLLWWFKHALFDLHVSPLFCDYLAFPIGFDYTYLPALVIPILEGLALQVLGASPMLAYNLIMLSTFVLSGFFAYLLCYRLTNNRAASFIGGLVFAFSPYHQFRTYGHIGLAHIQFLPLFALVFLIAIEKKTAWRYWVLAGILIGINGLCDWSYFGYCLVFATLWLGLDVLRKRTVSGETVAGTIAMAIGALLIVGVPLWLIFDGMGKGELLPSPSSESIAYSADLMSYFVPQLTSSFIAVTIGSNWLYSVYYSRLQFAESNLLFMGYSVIALCCFAITRNYRKLEPWILIGFVSMILSLGPVLHVYGSVLNSGTIFGPPTKYVFGFIPWNVVESLSWAFENLPFSFMEKFVPGASLLHVPARFDTLVTLCLAVLTAVGVVELRKKLSESHVGVSTAMTAIAIVGLVILVEYASLPFKDSSTPIPSVIYELGEQRGEFAVINVPGEFGSPLHDYYQVFHLKKMVGGYYQHNLVTDERASFIRQTPAISSFYFSPEFGRVFPLETQPERIKAILNYYDIRYVLIYKSDCQLFENVYGYDDFCGYLKNLSTSISSSVAYDDQNLTVYQVQNSSVGGIVFGVIGKGWGSGGTSNGVYGKEVCNSAELTVINSFGHAVTGVNMTFLASGWENKPVLRASLLRPEAASESHEIEVAPDAEWRTYVIQLGTLEPGANTYIFSSNETEHFAGGNVCLMKIGNVTFSYPPNIQ
jgi:hypothetical protein